MVNRYYGYEFQFLSPTEFTSNSFTLTLVNGVRSTGFPSEPRMVTPWPMQKAEVPSQSCTEAGASGEYALIHTLSKQEQTLFKDLRKRHSSK